MTQQILTMKKIKLFLIVNSNGTCRVTKNAPDLKWNEVSLLLNLELPNELFTRPQFTATLSVPQGAATVPTIDIKMGENIAELIKQATGLECKLTIETQE